MLLVHQQRPTHSRDARDSSSKYRLNYRSVAPQQAQRVHRPLHVASSSSESKMGFLNQLDALKSMSVVVADSGDVNAVKKYTPIDCTTNPSLVLKAVQIPEYAHYLKQAIAEEKLNGSGGLSYSDVVDRISVNIGADLLKIVPGRVSTEVDASLSYDKDKLLEKAYRLIGLYEAKGIDKSRVYIKLASTWEGIQACAELQKDNIDCNMTLMFSFAQGVACANAGAALCSPFVGRILDYYKAKEGRDFTAEEDPGVLAVQRVYNYYKKYGASTTVMAASFRNIGEIQQLAGIDAITISPSLLEELAGLSQPLSQRLAPEGGAEACVDQEYAGMLEADFHDMHNSDSMAVEKLVSGIEGFSKDQATLEDMLKQMVEQDSSLSI